LLGHVSHHLAVVWIEMVKPHGDYGKWLVTTLRWCGLKSFEKQVEKKEEDVTTLRWCGLKFRRAIMNCFGFMSPPCGGVD